MCVRIQNTYSATMRVRIRVRSDKDRTGTITIVPVRTGTVILEKYRKF